MPAMERVNILLVDDQPAKLLSYEVILKSLGQNLLKANSAREALEILLKNDVAVVLADVCMPELDGFELAKMLREHPRYESTAVIFISAVHLGEEDRARGYELGAVDYVSVPVVPEILRAKVRVFLDLYRKTRELEQLNAQLEQRVRERTIELQETNGRLRESEERLRLASEAAEFGTYDYNGAADSIHCSPHLKRLLNTDVSGDLSLAAFVNLVHPDDREAVHDAMLSAGSEATARHEIEFRSAPAAGGRWLLDRGRSFKVGTSGEKPVVRTMGTILDITTRKMLEERQKLLIAELDHRVKNVMANVSAMARLSSRRADSLDAFLTTLEGRLQSMASAHVLLSQRDWSSADLSELAVAVLAPFRSQHGDTIALNGDQLNLRPKAAQDLALVLHELATNAVKHGALSSPEGKVHVRWSNDPAQGMTEIVWRESGGPAVRAPDKRGLGLSIIETALSESRTAVECTFAEAGFVCTIRGALAGAWPQSIGQHATTAFRFRAPQRGRARNAPEQLRILLVEDEQLVAMQLRSELEHRGHTVLGPATSLSAGLQLASSSDFDIALVDISLGRDTSAEIAKLLDSRGIPFAFATGYTDGALLPDRLRDRPRIAKPYLIEDVCQVITELLDARSGINSVA